MLKILDEINETAERIINWLAFDVPEPTSAKANLPAAERIQKLIDKHNCKNKKGSED